jgi:hypothetical protein
MRAGTLASELCYWPASSPASALPPSTNPASNWGYGAAAAPPKPPLMASPLGCGGGRVVPPDSSCPSPLSSRNGGSPFCWELPPFELGSVASSSEHALSAPVHSAKAATHTAGTRVARAKDRRTPARASRQDAKNGPKKPRWKQLDRLLSEVIPRRALSRSCACASLLTSARTPAGIRSGARPRQRHCQRYRYCNNTPKRVPAACVRSKR